MKPTFTYECPRCHRRWDEQRYRDDEDLDLSLLECWCVEACPPYNPEGPFLGDRVFAPSTIALHMGRK